MLPTGAIASAAYFILQVVWNWGWACAAASAVLRKHGHNHLEETSEPEFNEPVSYVDS